jgi:hypothetical protein
MLICSRIKALTSTFKQALRFFVEQLAQDSTVLGKLLLFTIQLDLTSCNVRLSKLEVGLRCLHSCFTRSERTTFVLQCSIQVAKLVTNVCKIVTSRAAVPHAAMGKESVLLRAVLDAARECADHCNPRNPRAREREATVRQVRYELIHSFAVCVGFDLCVGFLFLTKEGEMLLLLCG